MMTQNPDQFAGKRIYLHRNGQPQYPSKMMVVNNRQVRDFNSFLVQATGGLKAPVAIRNIYTPMNGTKISALNQLQTGQHYVAGGSEKFKKEKYEGNTMVLLPKRRPYHPFQVPPRMHQAVVASARYKKPTEKPITIHVYRNGDERYHGTRILLNKKSQLTMDKVLEIITEKAELFTPAKRLYTVDGQPVESIASIQNKCEYVAVEGAKSFSKVAYAKEITLNKTISPTKKLVGIKPRHLQHEGRVTDPRTSLTQEEVVSPGRQHNRNLRVKPPFRVPPMKASKKFTRKERPMGGRKDKEAREIALKDTREDSVFGGSPVLTHSMHRMPSPPGSAVQQPPSKLGMTHKSQTPSPPTPSPPTPSPPAQSPPSQSPPTQSPPAQSKPTPSPPSQSPPAQSKPTPSPPAQLPPQQQQQGQGEDDSLHEVVEEEEVTQEEPVDTQEMKSDVVDQSEEFPSGDTAPEEIVEEEIEQQPSQPSDLMEFQSKSVKQSVDLSVRRQDAIDSPSEERDPISDGTKHASPLSQASKSSIKSKQEGNLNSVSRTSLRSNASVKSKKSEKMSNSSKVSLRSSSQIQGQLVAHSKNSPMETTAKVDAHRHSVSSQDQAAVSQETAVLNEQVNGEERVLENDRNTSGSGEGSVHAETDSLVDNQSDDAQLQEV